VQKSPVKTGPGINSINATLYRKVYPKLKNSVSGTHSTNGLVQEERLTYSIIILKKLIKKLMIYDN
jgi:hypothetical protein